MLLCDQLGLGDDAKTQLFTRMVFNVLAYNRDDHVKQISFLMDKAGQWSLSPAYDMTYAYNPAGEFTSNHQMTINRKRDNILIEDFMAVARRQGIEATTAREAMVRVNEAVSHWNKYALLAGVADQQSQKIALLIVPTG